MGTYKRKKVSKKTSKKVAKKARTKPGRKLAMPDEQWMPVFLRALAEVHDTTKAAEVAGVSRKTAYRRKESHPEFAAKWADVMNAWADPVEATYYDCVLNGVPKIVTYNGRVTDTYRELNLRSMEHFLSRFKPERWGDSATGATTAQEHAAQIREALIEMRSTMDVEGRNPKD